MVSLCSVFVQPPIRIHHGKFQSDWDELKLLPSWLDMKALYLRCSRFLPVQVLHHCQISKSLCKELYSKGYRKT